MKQHSQHACAATTGPATGRCCCLVTGGAGFIGSHLVEQLLARGDQVVVVDNLSTGRRCNLTEHPQLHFLEMDLAQAIKAFSDQGSTFDEIYHLAAAVGVQLVLDTPIEAIDTNIRDTASLLSLASSMEPLPRVFLASSSEVYGKGSRCPFSEDDDVVYGPTIISRWSYGMSKAIDEHLGLAHHERSGLPVTIARFFNTVGPRQIGRYGMVLPRFVAAALENQPLLIHGTGSQSRCFCDVRDVVAALPKLITSAQCLGRVFNLGSDSEITINELADLVINTLGSQSSITHRPYQDVFGPGFEDLPRRQPNLDRVKKAIGFSPTIDLATTIKDLATSLRADRTHQDTHSSHTVPSSHGAGS